MVEMYGEIGLEVHLEPLATKEELEEEGASSCADKGCTVCFDVDRDRYRIIFTKLKDNK